ncbi:MAG: hypothetical protein AAGI67_13490 [Pseudomonadota bacterium]
MNQQSRTGLLRSVGSRSGACRFGLLIFALGVLSSPGVAEEATAEGGQPVPTGCDLLAAHPSDPDKITDGLKTAEVMKHLDSAIAACRRDAALYPDQPRLTYYLGRSQFYAGQAEAGYTNVKTAADGGHEQAQFVAGLLALSGAATGAADPCLALDFWEKARAQAHFAATVSVAAHQKMDTFAACQQPDAASVRASVEALSGHRYAGEYYNQLLLQVLALAD